MLPRRRQLNSCLKEMRLIVTQRLYFIVTQRSPTTYEVANPINPHEVLGPYHSSALRSCINKEATPVMPLRKRGRPSKDNSAGSSSRTIPRNQRGSVTNGNRVPSPGRVDT
ncbi:hypothetical protein TNCV_2287301 [Trichonephila clavipes]|nr:hypothetical protein TNCV_2287301 [Trichonephila clavipes]